MKKKKIKTIQELLNMPEDTQFYLTHKPNQSHPTYVAISRSELYWKQLIAIIGLIMTGRLHYTPPPKPTEAKIMEKSEGGYIP